MSEEEQEKLYELLFKDTKNKLEETIKKQQTEIEELKQENKDHLEALTEWVNGERINDIKHISKDKIREKIKELEETMKQDEVDEFGIHSIGWSVLDYVVEQLKELLKE